MECGMQPPAAPAPAPAAAAAGSAAPAAPPPVRRELALGERRHFPYLVGMSACLSLLAGYINIVAYVNYGSTVAHQSGKAAKTAYHISRSAEHDAGLMALLLFSFVTGATLTGTMVHGGKFVLGSRYGLLLILVATLLGVGIVAAEHGALLTAAALWAGAMGVQNAMCTGFSGAVVRTTHMTGLLTDVGLILGQWVKHALLGSPRPDVWKLKLLLSILTGFWSGGAIGYQAAGRFVGTRAAVPVVVLMLVAGLVYMAAQARGAFDSFLAEAEIDAEIEQVENEVRSAAIAALREQGASAARSSGMRHASVQLSHRYGTPPIDRRGSNEAMRGGDDDGSRTAACEPHVRPIDAGGPVGVALSRVLRGSAASQHFASMRHVDLQWAVSVRADPALPSEAIDLPSGGAGAPSHRQASVREGRRSVRFHSCTFSDLPPAAPD